MFTPHFLSRNPVREVRLAELTTARIGGPATLVMLESREDLTELLEKPHRWLGRGANLLVGDNGVPEPVVRLGRAFGLMEPGESRSGRATVRAGAAVDLAELVSTCVKAGLTGPEGLAGVPATVGGALRMNAGTATCWMMDWVARVEVVLPGETSPCWIERSAIPATYRSSGLPEGTLFLGCEMELASGDPEALRATSASLKSRKAATQPLALPSFGCTFKNPSPSLPAGRLIEELGLKGLRVGGAIVSPVHANFIVNPERQATCADVVAIISHIRTAAWRERSINLELEVETWAVNDCVRAHPASLAAVSGMTTPATAHPTIRGTHAG